MSGRSKKRRAQRKAATDERERRGRDDDSGGEPSRDENEDQSPTGKAGDAAANADGATGAKGALPTVETQSDTVRTDDLPSLRKTWSRHDLWVVLAALAVLAAASIAHRTATAPKMREFRLRGLSFLRPEGFLPPTPVARETSAVASALATAATGAQPLSDDTSPPSMDPLKPAPPPSSEVSTAPYHVVYQGPTDPLLRLEVRIDTRPLYNNLVAALSLYRAGRYGGSYWASDSRIRNIAGRDWTRTEFRYTHKASETDSPQVATAIEYATLNEDLLYVVTCHGNPEQALELSEMVAPTLTVRAISPPGESTP